MYIFCIYVEDLGQEVLKTRDEPIVQNWQLANSINWGPITTYNQPINGSSRNDPLCFRHIIFDNFREIPHNSEHCVAMLVQNTVQDKKT